MKTQLHTTIRELRSFIILWAAQSLSFLGSSMTNFAVIIWSYQNEGSALSTALLAVCSYTPYILLSIFAGALSDRWNKKTVMLVSDCFAALCTVSAFCLLITGSLQIWHLYIINTLNGLMNTIQQPASDVAITLLTPVKHYQKVSGMQSFSRSLVTVLTPVCAAALLSFTSLEFVFLFDLLTFAAAFVSLLFFVKIPKIEETVKAKTETVLQTVKNGLRYLKDNRGILNLILFLAVINFTASIFNAALPAMMLSRNGQIDKHG